jgi:hypothetical protein
MRAFAAVPIAVVVCAATPAFADASAHVAAAKKAERNGDWRKALQEWKAAYAAEPNAEYLIGVGDALTELGNKAEAKKNYEAYLIDPLALPANVEKVKKKLAQLNASGNGALALPAPTLPLPSVAPTAPAPKTADKARKADTGLALPGLELPAPAGAPAPAKTASADKPALPLPGLPATTTMKKEPDKVASAAPLLPLPLPGAPAKTETKKESAPAVATKESSPKPIAMVAPPAERPSERAPAAAVTATVVPREPQGRASGVQRTMAYVTAGVAIAALGGGVFAFTQANSAHNDLTSKIHSGADAQRLVEDEKRNKTLSFVGFAGGLVAAGIATALFAF